MVTSQTRSIAVVVSARPILASFGSQTQIQSRQLMSPPDAWRKEPKDDSVTQCKSSDLATVVRKMSPRSSNGISSKYLHSLSMRKGPRSIFVAKSNYEKSLKNTKFARHWKVTSSNCPGILTLLIICTFFGDYFLVDLVPFCGRNQESQSLSWLLSWCVMNILGQLSQPQRSSVVNCKVSFLVQRQDKRDQNDTENQKCHAYVMQIPKKYLLSCYAAKIFLKK